MGNAICREKKKITINTKEDVMKNLTLGKRIAVLLTVIIANATTVWAADAAREDNSGLFVWIFFSFCALIIVAQLIPATMLLLGLAKGVKKETSPAKE